MAEDLKCKRPKLVASVDNEGGSSTCETNHTSNASGHLSGHDCLSPQNKNDIAAEDSYQRCSQIQNETLKNKSVNLGHISFLSNRKPEIDYASVVLDQSNTGMETTGELAESHSFQVGVSVVQQVQSPGKGKRRQRHGGSPNSLSGTGGSPYSSDSLSSSSLSVRLTSRTTKDTYSNETNENSSSSCEAESDKEKTSFRSMVNFDRVVHDAPKREHIRSRKSTGSRTSQVGKSSFSQSSSNSQSRGKPTKVQTTLYNKPHGRISEIADSGTSTSGCSLTHTDFDKKNIFESKGAAGYSSNCTDTGINTASTSGHSIQYQSNFSVSSSSGVDTHLSAGKDRKKAQLCKSVGSHYHDIRNANKGERSKEVRDGSAGDGSAAHHHKHHLGNHSHEQGYSRASDSVLESERKRRRFNRTFVLLRHCGLLELTLQTASLMQQSSLMVQQLKSLRQQTEVLYSAIQTMAVRRPTASFDTDTAQKILHNLKEIINRNGGLSDTSHPLVLNHHARKVAIKRTSSGKTIGLDSGNAQSSSALHNSGSFT